MHRDQEMTLSEIDVEHPITPNQGVHSVSMYNHPWQTLLVVADYRLNTSWMTWYDGNFDGSATSHYYTICYIDNPGTITRYIDGGLIYTAGFKWNASLGGTGHGPDPVTLIGLAVGGAWPGNLANPSSYYGDLDIYSIDYYGP